MQTNLPKRSGASAAGYRYNYSLAGKAILYPAVPYFLLICGRLVDPSFVLLHGCVLSFIDSWALACSLHPCLFDYASGGLENEECCIG